MLGITAIVCGFFFVYSLVVLASNSLDKKREHETAMAKLGYSQKAIWDGDIYDPGYPIVWVKKEDLNEQKIRFKARGTLLVQ